MDLNVADLSAPRDLTAMGDGSDADANRIGAIADGHRVGQGAPARDFAARSGAGALVAPRRAPA